ncbi:MAG: hypothetical protein DSY92_02110 [Planctomycetota bacterium]|nr:MAG: hypothetical protein DSY92_02110 [Planctomycetota bacterium]
MPLDRPLSGSQELPKANCFQKTLEITGIFHGKDIALIDPAPIPRIQLAREIVIRSNDHCHRSLLLASKTQGVPLPYAII